ncbi:hypothetical protein [Streptomyces flaveolus]|uniref:hypothetical protein n=1 Tax=Streptomyces flaveolus TaxID=67297 RepID=UPI0033F9BEAF
MEALTVGPSHRRSVGLGRIGPVGACNRLVPIDVLGLPREAIAAAQRNLTAVTHPHDDHVTTHAARGHLHHLAATLVTLDKAQRTLHEGIWDIAAARRAQHDQAKGLCNGYDEQRATADLTPALTAGEARIAHLRSAAASTRSATPRPPDAAAQHSADAEPRPSRRTAPSTPAGHDQATAAALHPGPAAHGGRTAGA